MKWTDGISSPWSVDRSIFYAPASGHSACDISTSMVTLIWKRRQNHEGMTPKDILFRLRYDPDMVPVPRWWWTSRRSGGNASQGTIKQLIREEIARTDPQNQQNGLKWAKYNNIIPWMFKLLCVHYFGTEKSICPMIRMHNNHCLKRGLYFFFLFFLFLLLLQTLIHVRARSE